MALVVRPAPPARNARRGQAAAQTPPAQCPAQALPVWGERAARPGQPAARRPGVVAQPAVVARQAGAVLPLAAVAVVGPAPPAVAVAPLVAVVAVVAVVAAAQSAISAAVAAAPVRRSAARAARSAKLVGR